MVYWLFLLPGFCATLLLAVKGVSGAGSVRFPNSALCGAKDDCTGVAEFWVLVFGASSGARASDGNGVSFAENFGGVKVLSGG